MAEKWLWFCHSVFFFLLFTQSLFWWINSSYTVLLHLISFWKLSHLMSSVLFGHLLLDNMCTRTPSCGILCFRKPINLLITYTVWLLECVGNFYPFYFVWSDALWVSATEREDFIALWFGYFLVIWLEWIGTFNKEKFPDYIWDLIKFLASFWASSFKEFNEYLVNLYTTYAERMPPKWCRASFLSSLLFCFLLILITGGLLVLWRMFFLVIEVLFFIKKNSEEYGLVEYLCCTNSVLCFLFAIISTSFLFYLFCFSQVLKVGAVGSGSKFSCWYSRTFCW